nr:uncharacterized protein LOC117281479 [Nicotiana tomentosiformis]
MNGARPIKQAQRRFRPNLVPLIEIEVNKLIKASFIREVNYPTWVSTIVPLMVDATTGYEEMSFMDGSSGYNQIRMAPKYEELNAFRTPNGIYCYKVKPFGFKNAGATYQRVMQNIFDNLLHKNVECYVDDFVVIKGQALADFLANHPILDDRELTNELPDEDAMFIEVQPPMKIYIDGVAHRGGACAGIVCVTSQSEFMPYSFTVT